MLRKQAISTLVHAAIVFFALTWACLAQGMIEPGGAGAPKYGLPGPICATDLSYLAVPEPQSSNDQHNGWVFGWSFARHCFQIEPPKLLIGPANIAGDIALTQSVFVPLDGAVGSGGTGFRAGAQYPPGGVYMVWGVYEVLTGGTANSRVEIKVTVGTTLGAGAQSTVLIGSPTIVGGGANTCVTAASYCEVTVFVPKMSCAAAWGQSCEVRFTAITTNVGDTVKQTTPNLPAGAASLNGVMRAGGQDSLQ
jgi:hypothetical protein